MNQSEFFDNLRSVSDIYSFIVMLFAYIDDDPTKIRSEYCKAINGNPVSTLNSVGALVKDLRCIGLTGDPELQDWITSWGQIFDSASMAEKTFCYITLLEIDKIINELKSNKKILEKRGPFGLKGEYAFYFKKPAKYFFSSLFEQQNIRRTRQTVECAVNSLNQDFNYFEVVKKSQLHDYYPIVYEYNKPNLLSPEFCVGLIPFHMHQWFETLLDHESKIFTITYNQEGATTHNNNIKALLQACDDRDVNVAILPEIVMNPTSKDEIIALLKNSNFKNLKLCFSGSMWHNNTNESFLISGQGTQLLSHKKKVPYIMYNKQYQQKYTEFITKTNEVIFLDIEGVGRIVYLICADINDQDLNTIYSVMHADFVFVSAFTSSMEMMLKTAEYNATARGVTTVLCNSCAAQELNKASIEIGYVVCPQAQDSQITAQIFPFNHCEPHLKCTSCIRKISISNDGCCKII